MNTIQKWKKSKKPDRTYNFLMFEIVLALLVIMIGMFGVSSMFPVGVSSQKEAVGTSYITDAAEQLLRLNASYIRNDWDWLKVFADAKPGTNDQGRAWNSTALFEVNNLRVKADAAFDLTSDNNSGLFLLEQLSLGQTDQAAIVRMWKDVTENDNSSIDATIYAEVSWPAEKPYYARNKEVFSLQVSKAPEIAIVDATYSDSDCSVTKVNGGGYSTTISSVVDNGDTTYTIELLVDHDGCGGADCPGISQLSIEADSGTYSDISIAGDINGEMNYGPSIDNESFEGFSLNYASGIGNGVSGTATVTYTLSSLQDQQVSVLAGSQAFVASFEIAEFDFVMSCTPANSANYVALADDDVFELEESGGMGTLSSTGGNSNYNTLVVDAPGVLENDDCTEETEEGLIVCHEGETIAVDWFTIWIHIAHGDTFGSCDGSNNDCDLEAVLVSGTTKGDLTLNSDGSFTYVPGPDFDGQDTFTYQTLTGSELSDPATVTINGTIDEDDIDFDITDGEIIPEHEYTADLKMLGAAITWGGEYDMPVTVEATVGSDTIEPWGSFDLAVDGNVNVGSSMEYTLPDVYPANTAVSIFGRSWAKIDDSYSGDSNSHWQQELEFDSASGTPNVLILRDGDAVPAIEPFQDQSSIVSFLQGYVDDATDTVILEGNQAIVLFELGTTDLSSSAADFQDLVVLVTLKRVVGE